MDSKLGSITLIKHHCHPDHLFHQENIGQFGGDPESVTLMGHGTGAALSGLLLLSPVSVNFVYTTKQASLSLSTLR